jgi:hypothetical protein
MRGEPPRHPFPRQPIARPEPSPQRVRGARFHNRIVRNPFEREREERSGHQRAADPAHPASPAVSEDGCFSDY